MAGEEVQVTVEEVRQLNAKILQLVDLPVLVPLLKESGVLSEEIVTKVNDFKHYTQFERSNFLLNFLYQQGQTAIDSFIECLRESKTTNHVEILRLLEGDLQDTPPRSPLFTILDKHINDIIKHINLISFLKSLLSVKAITLNTFLDLQNTDRTLRETLDRLFPVLEAQGSKGFISFLSCLQKDLPNPGHERLSEVLFTEVSRFFKEHPDRDQVSHSDRIEIQQLERREKIIGQEIRQKLIRHRETLVAQIKAKAALPGLYKREVISMQDRDYLSQLEGEALTKKLLDLLQEKESNVLVKFADCLKETEDNREAGELLLPSPQKQTSELKKPEVATKKLHEKMAVFVYADHYLSPNGNPINLEPQRFDQSISEHRETLKRQLENMGFHTHTLDTDIEKDDFSDVPQIAGSGRSRVINDRFRKEVVENCSKDAVVFIFLSGIQFPCKVEKGEYRGAILRTNASNIGRLPLDSIVCQDVAQWVGELPSSHVTILIDSDPSHVVAFNKMHQIAQVEIMEDPWTGLTAFDSSTVVFYLKPDPEAMAEARGSRVGSPLGMLTEVFTKAIVSCVMKSKEEVSHRSLFEAISFYWYSGKDGPLHKLFKPTITGDVDRSFLDKTSIPYQQVFRADLKRREESGGKEVFLNQIKIPVGTMAGLIQGDQLEVFHVLRPGVQVSGHVSTAYQLYCEAVIEEGAWPQLHGILQELYKDGELKEATQSLEFLLVRKKFPLRQRLAVYPRELDRGASNSLKMYIKEHSNLLSFVPQEKDAKVVVSFQAKQYHLEDIGKDVKYPMRTKSVERVKSLLEMVAWYKYSKSLKSKQKVMPHHECSLTAALPLLSPAAPICRDFEMYWSSWIGASPATLGYEAILSFAEPPRFWTPAVKDSAHNLTVHFKRNRLITAVEFRGDPTFWKFVRQADMNYNKTISERVLSPSDAKVLDVDSEEPVQYVVFKVDAVEKNAEFTVAMKLKAKRTGPKTKSGYLDKLWLYKPWPPPSDYTIIPPCDHQTGFIQLNPDIFIWKGKGGGELTLNLHIPCHLEKIEFIDLSGVNKLTVSLETSFVAIPTNEFPSPHPKKYYFPRPIFASTVIVRPTQLGDNPSGGIRPMPPAGDIRLQLQLHGNIHNQPLDLDEENVMLFQFNTLADMQLYFYILCFEETGAVTLLNEGYEMAPCPREETRAVTLEEVAPRPHSNVYVFPPSKLLLQALIPREYKPEAGHILDEYHIWVSPTQLYIEPFLQRGVHAYHTPITYNICTLGLRTDEVVKDDWYDHHYSVKVKKI